MATKSKVEAELQKVGKTQPKRGEDPQVYRSRLIDAVQEKVDADEDLWEKLSGDAQNWINAGSGAVNDKKNIPAFPGDEPEEEAEDEEDAPEEDSNNTEDGDDPAEDAVDENEEDGETNDEEEEKVVTKKTATKKGAVKKAAPEKKAPAKKAETIKKKAEPEKKVAPEKKIEKKTAAPRAARSGVQQLIKKLILKTPGVTVDQLVEKLEKAGHKPSRLAVSSIRSGFRDSMRVIKDAGYLEDIEL